MDEKKRLAKLALDAADYLGSNAELSRYLGVSRALITEYIKGRSIPNGDKVVKLQDLLKRAACVLAAAGAATLLPYHQADAHTAFNKTPIGIHIVHLSISRKKPAVVTGRRICA